MERRSSVYLRAGGGLWILAGGLHMSGRLWPAGPLTEEAATLNDLMAAVPLNAGFGVTRSAAEVVDGVSLGFALLLFLAGFLVVLMGQPGLLPTAVNRRVAGMNALAAAALFTVAVRQLPLSLAMVTGLAAAAFVVAALTRTTESVPVIEADHAD